jgi:hypothetical protein
MIKLHYAESNNLGKDINELIIKNTNELKLFLNGIRAKDNGNTVYLFTSNHSFDPDDNNNEYSTEIYIESDPLTLSLPILRCLDYSGCTLYLQEYQSFEDAYRVALSMRELNHLCYNK